MAPLAGIEPASTLLNRQPRAPCSPEGNDGGAPRTRTELDLLAREVRGPCACPDGALSARELVLGVGFEPTSPRLQRGAFTRSAFRAFGADGGNRTRTTSVAPKSSAIELH